MLDVVVVPSPLEWTHWEQAKAYLEPARARGDFPDVIEPDEELFAVLDGDELLAVATAWMDAERKYVEIKLVGGRERHRWLGLLNNELGRLARAAGATRLTACGRRGWAKSLSALGWERIGEVDGSFIYAQDLGAVSV